MSDKRPLSEMLSRENVIPALRRASQSQREVFDKLRELSDDQEFPSFEQQMKDRHGED